MKRKILTVFTLIFALCTSLAIFAACGSGKNPPQSGDEVGVYYCEVDGSEWTITLSEGCKFTYAVGGETKSGTYTLEGVNLALRFDKKSEPEQATLENSVLTYTYGGTPYRFLLKCSFTVTFAANGDIYTSVDVLNGKTVARPAQDPEKAEHVFVGWYEESAFRNLYNFDRPVTDNLTLYARFVEDVTGAEEYTVYFDLGYEGAEEIAARETMGGKLYNLPAPKKEGDVFVGWWVSHYNDGAKLTYQYNEHALKADTTLFAVWQSDAPYVSIDENEIVWRAEGVNNSYTVVITGPEGEIHRGTSGVTTYTYDFASQKEGEYTVSVTVGGKTTVAYYMNRALAKATGFRVEGNTFLFNPVENATSYVLNFICGTAEHNHSTVALGTDTFYDFSNCDLPEDGFKFVVTASAESWVASVSEEFQFTRTLNAVADLAVDANTDVVTWSAAENATSYYIMVTEGGETLFEGSVTELSFNLTGYNAGDYVVAVYPVARGWNSPAAETTAYNKVRLATPANLRLSGTTLYWDAVTGVTGYEVMIGNNTYTANTNAFEFTDEHVVAGQSSYQISVRALGANAAANSFYSAVLTANQGELTDSLVYNEGVLSWDAVFGVNAYVVQVNDGNTNTVTTSWTEITLTKKGDNVLAVAAVLADGSYSEWRTVTVTAYALSFDTQEGTAVPTQYYAKGDPITLPTATKTGYTLVGWYETPNGAEGGSRFEETTYTRERDITLYAAWTANKYTVTFNVGLYGEELESEEVTYDATYKLSIPVSKNEEYAFAGWYLGTAQYTDHEGNSSRIWTDDMPRTLEARWVELYTFTEVTGGYAVSKGPGINYVTAITIPQNHGGKPVITINGFENVMNLKSVTFYDTITNITVGSIGIAFVGCTSLEDINVIRVEGTHERKYWSVDGILLGNDTTTGDVLIYYYPQKHVLENNTFYVPDGVTRLTAGVFPADGSTSTTAGNPWTIFEIVVPASVRQVDANTFNGIMPLHIVRFLDSMSGVEEPLNIEDGAFQNLWGLWEVHFPARLTEVSAAAFIDAGGNNGLRRLYSVTVADGGENFATIGGLLARITESGGRELVYYPLPRTAPRTQDSMTVSEIVIPEGITAIASNSIPSSRSSATAENSELGRITKITIASTVSYIAPYAFSTFVSGNNGLQEIVWKSTAESVDLTIDEGAFYGNRHLPREITLPENLVSLGAYAFGNMGNTTNLLTVNVNVGGYGRTIKFAKNAFAFAGTSTHYSYVGTVNFGPNVPEMVISEVFGASVNTLNVDPANDNYVNDNGVFWNKAHTNILFISADADLGDTFIVPDGTDTIPANQYKDRKFTTISFPASLREIGSQAFVNNTELTTIIFREGEEGVDVVPLVIGDGAFQGCKNLKNLVLPARTVSIGDSAFQGGTSATARAGLESITLNEGLKSIGANAFANTNLTSISIPASVETLVKTRTTGGTGGLSITYEIMEVFKGASKLAAITVDPANQNYASIDGVLYGKTEGVITDLLYVPTSCSANEGVLTVPNTVTKVWADFFADNGATVASYNATGAVTEIKFAEGVKNLVLAPYAFHGNTARQLEKLTLPEGLVEIGEYALGTDNWLLTSINIPSTVRKIAKVAFNGWRKLAEITFADGEEPLVLEGGYTPSSTSTILPSSGFAMFSGTNLKSIVLPNRVTEIGDYVFSSLTGLTSINIPKNVTVLGVGVFYGCTALKTLTFAEDGNLEEIGWGTFYNVRGVTELNFPASLRVIGKQAFYAGSTAGVLASINFPTNSQLESIGEQAFSGAKVTALNFPASLKTIGEKAFGYNSSSTTFILANLTTITFAENNALESIGKHAFGYATKLNSVNFGTPLQAFTIGEGAFMGCSALASISFPATLKELTKGAASGGVFYNCTNLATVTFAEGETYLETIGDYAFKGTKVTNLKVPASKSEITLGLSLFDGATTPLTIHLSEQVVSIDGAFAGNTFAEITIDVNNKNFSKDPQQPIVYDAVGSIIIIYGEINGTLTMKSGALSIGAAAFQNQTGLTKIVIPASVTEIGNNAFNGCTALVEVEFGNNSALISIGASAFAGCTALTTINLEQTSHITSFGANAFSGCSKLQTVDLSRNVGLTQLNSNVFLNTTALGATEGTYVRLPRTLEYIGLGAFMGSGIREIDLSAMSDLDRIRNAAATTTVTTSSSATNTFKNCVNLVTVQLPIRCTAIGASTFEGCTSLRNINLGSVEIFGQNVFKGCTSLDTIDISSARGLGNYAFSGTGITSLTLSITGTNPTASGTASSNASSLCDYVFRDCKALRTVVIAEGVEYLRQYTFAGCTALETVTFSSTVNFDGNSSISMYTYHTFDGCTALKNVIFNENATDIVLTQYMFLGCTALESITLPKGLIRIRANAFQNCTSLKSVTFSGDTANITFDNYVFDNCGFETFEIPNATAIGTYFLSNNKNLTSVSFAAGFSLTALPANMFANCTKLTSITGGLPASITTLTVELLNLLMASDATSYEIPAQITSIDGKAFQNKTKLQSVTIPAGVTNVGANAFDGCTSLASVTFLGDTSQITFGNYVFQNCAFTSFEIPKAKSIGTYFLSKNTKLKSVTFASGFNLETLPGYLFTNCSALGSVTLPDCVKNTGANTFQNCTSLTSVTLPAGLTAVGNYAFDGCSALEGVELPSGLTTLGTYVFRGCSKLKTIVIPTGITNIGSYAFANCSSLDGVKLHEGITTIGTYAFQNCKALTSIVIPNTVTNLGGTTATAASRVFEGCTSLKTVVVGNGVKAIGTYTFSGCTSLERIVIGSAVTAVGANAFNGCTALKAVCFAGTTVPTLTATNNASYSNATKYNYSEQAPTGEGNFWHYGKNGNIVIWGEAEEDDGNTVEG